MCDACRFLDTPLPAPQLNPPLSRAPYLLHLFEVIVEFGPFGSSNLLADQLGTERKEDQDGAGGSRNVFTQARPKRLQTCPQGHQLGVPPPPRDLSNKEQDLSVNRIPSSDPQSQAYMSL